MRSVCAVLTPRELLLGRTEGGAASAQWFAAASGALAQGVRVLDAGVCTLPQLRHALRALRCDAAALTERDRLTPLNARGARLLTRQQRGVCGQNARQDFIAPFSGDTPPVERADALRSAYICDVASEFTADPDDAPKLALYAEDETLARTARDALGRAGLYVRSIRPDDAMDLAPGEVGLQLDAQGERCTLYDADGALNDAERQLLMAWTLLRLGERTLLMPVQATRAIQRLAGRFDAQVEYVAGESALWMNALAERFPRQFDLQFDGLRAALTIFSALAEARLTLRGWLRDMPMTARRSRSIPVPHGLTGRILRAMASRERHVELGGGMRFTRERGWAWICPDETRPEFRIVAEAANEEYARELCDFCESELKKIASEKS